MSLRTSALLLLALPGWGGAAELESLAVLFEDGRLVISSQSRLKAGEEATARALSDYRNLPALLPVIREVNVLPGENSGVERVSTVVEGCVWLFCKSLDHVMDVHSEGAYAWRGETVTALSDFRTGEADWHLEPLGEDTRLYFEANLEPRLSLPPVIGPWLLEQRVRGEIEDAVEHLEGALGLEAASCHHC